MILTDYYLLKELKELKSHRLDCVASTGGYNPFEQIAQRSKVKRFFCYFNGVPKSFSVHTLRKAEMAITNGDNISSVFIPDINQHQKGYGDTKGTADGLLFLFSDDYKQMEIFVARGYKYDMQSVCNLFLAGELDGEMEVLRKTAKSTGDNTPEQ